jgi:glycine/D-amino acid oxidase-like deaminating enzyme
MPRAIAVGAGVFGSSVADRLALTGWEVVLVDMEEPGHERSSSGDETRLLRYAHGTDAWYTRSARRARELWRELEADMDVEVFVEHGLVWFAHAHTGWEADSEATMLAAEIPAIRLSVDEAAALYPSLGTDDLEWALLEPEAGVLRARRATQALAQRAKGNGADLVSGRARPDGAAVVLDTGERLEGDRVVWACGAWLGKVFPELVSLRVTQQDVIYFEAPEGWGAPHVPGWVDYEGAAYGHGNLDGHGFKAAPDREGPPFDPDTGERVLLPAHLETARAYLARRFPALADAPLAGHRTCQYELTPDTHFIAAPHPEHDRRVWLLGGGSGHGFKHGPALAERMEEWLDGTADADPRFALGERAPDRALRTAGGAGPRAVAPD